MTSKASAKLDQLEGKRRSYADVSRFVGSRSAGTANYSLLLGAGCSISSNVKSASQLISEWREAVFARLCPAEPYSEEKAVEYLTKNHAGWYNPQREYASLFEKNFDLPRQRRMFVEKEVAGKAPNLGYAYLVRLIEEGFFNTVFTTNFDDLINESFFQFSQTRPIVCAHDSGIGSITVTSKRPKVIKLHGDYLFDDIKATVRETESLEDNTRKKFMEFCRDFGLIVVGYAGHDRSIMDVLQHLLRSDDYFKSGVYWCLRKGDHPSDELVKLLWRDRVYFVEIDGFDELMASLHGDLVGSSLPIDSGVVTNKPKHIIKGFCENPYLNDSPSEIIRRDLDRLRRRGDREELFSVLRDAREDSPEKERASVDIMSERDLATILDIKNFVSTGDFDTARARIRRELESRPSKLLSKELSELRIRVEELAGDLGAAVTAVDWLIEDDPKESEHYIRKTYLTVDHEERLRILEIAESLDRYNYRLYARRAKCCMDAYNAGLVPGRADLLRRIEEDLEKCFQLEPGPRNEMWREAAAFYSQCGFSKDVFRTKLDSLVERCEKFGPWRIVTLRVRLERWSRYKQDRRSEESRQLLEDIATAKLKSAKSLHSAYEWVHLDALRDLDRKDDLSRRLSELAVIPDLAETREYYRRKADFLTRFNGDMQGAVSALRSAAKLKFVLSDVIRLCSLLEAMGDGKGILDVISEYSSRLSSLEKCLLKRMQLIASNDIEGALAQLRSSFTKRLVSSSHKVAEVHDLLILGRNAEAGGIAKEILEAGNWNKTEFGELIVNYELALVRQGQSVNRKRLSELVDVAQNDSIKACANYLLGEVAKAKEAFVGEIRDDREKRFIIPKWAIFNDARGRAFIEGVLGAVG